MNRLSMKKQMQKIEEFSFIFDLVSHYNKNPYKKILRLMVFLQFMFVTTVIGICISETHQLTRRKLMVCILHQTSLAGSSAIFVEISNQGLSQWSFVVKLQ